MYRLFDGIVSCDFPLSGVPEVRQGEADVQVRLGEGGVNDDGYDHLHAWRESDGELILSCSRKQDSATTRYLLRFPDLADFETSSNTITCYPHPQCREDSLRHLLLDQVIPRLWAHRGHLVLHASAVQLPDERVVAFLGESGWGKSTLAAALQARGSRLLSDDSLSLQPTENGVVLVPSYTGLRLNDDSITTLGLAEQQWTSVSHYSEKRRFEPAAAGHGEPFRLDTLFIMDEPNDSTVSLSIQPLTGAELITTLIKRSFLLDPEDKHCATRQLLEASGVMRATSNLRSLNYPRNYLHMPDLCDALLASGTQ